MRDDWGIVGGIVFVVMFLPAIGSAQMIQGIPRSPMAPTVMSGGKVPEDVYIMPWIATGVVYDDNVFFAGQGRTQEDVFLRVTPGLQASYQSTPFTIIGDYRFDSEVYSKLDQLNTAQQRQFGTVETRWRPSTSWTVGTTVGYAQTNTPFELNILTSAQTARFRTERYFVNPTAEYRIDQSTKLIGQYAFAKDMFRGVEINSNIINASLEHRFGPHDTLGPAYVGRYFTFDVDPNGSLGFLGNPASFQSHAMQLSWGHEFSSDTRMEVRAGPRFTRGQLDNRPEAFVRLSQRIPNGEIGLSYISAITTIVGTVGGTQTDSISISARQELFKHFTVTAAPMATWIRNSSFDSTIYTGYIEAAYQLNQFVTAKGSAYLSYQEGNFVPTGGGTADNVVIARNVYWLRLEFSYPSRWNIGSEGEA